MPSRSVFLPISTNKSVTPDDVNHIYHLLNGNFSSSRGLGMSVQFTAYDGRLSTGLVDIIKYALEVRNRETTAQKTFAARRADNKIVFAIEGGLVYAVKDTNIATNPTQLVVYDTPAGGVLGGTYPNPTFAIATEYHRVYPKMVMEWMGSSGTTARADGFGGFNSEVTDAPGWVFCTGQTVVMRDGSSVVVPDMRDRYPIGAGSTYAAGNTAGNSLATQQAVNISHTHTIQHAHLMPHTHDFNHTHQLSAHVHGLNSHTHTLGTHTHTTADHTHNQNDHTHTMQNHFHDFTHTHTHIHGHGVSDISVSVNEGTDSSSADSTTVSTGVGTPINVPSFAHGHAAVWTLNTVNGTTDSILTNTSGPENPSGVSNSSTSGPNNNTTSAPSTSGTGNITSGASAGNTTSGPTGASDGASGNTAGPNSDITNAISTTTTGQPSAASTNNNDTANSGTSSVTTVNAQPPTLALLFIFKL